MKEKNDNVGKCGHTKCAGGKLCYEKGAPMSEYKPVATPKIIDKEITEEGASYRIDFGEGMVLWFDVWTGDDGEIEGNWNKYIFHTDQEQDMKEDAFQNGNSDEAGAYNFATAFEIASEAYENDRQN